VNPDGGCINQNVAYLDTQRFDRLSEKEVLDRIGTLLAIAIGRSEEQRRLNALVGAPQAAPVGDPDLAALDLTQLVTDPLEAQIIIYLRVAGRANAREVATALGLAAPWPPKSSRGCAPPACAGSRTAADRRVTGCGPNTPPIKRRSPARQSGGVVRREEAPPRPSSGSG
jgi:hypothetical protein